MVTSVLERPTLVLNRNWQPIGVSTVARSLIKLWNRSCLVVDPEDYRQYEWSDWAALPVGDADAFVQACSFRLRVPEVITLTRFDRVPVKEVPFSRRNVFKRDHFRCQYCGSEPGSEELTIDHVVPRSQGGISSWDNCVLACVACNKEKADRTPDQAHMPLRSVPKRPRWKPTYAARGIRVESWQKFISEAYWTAELEK
ncbi:MAG: HNH endonuclease [Pirellulaceae bacterium]|nr:HNH endonuclease [Planctomycetales bacterium]